MPLISEPLWAASRLAIWDPDGPGIVSQWTMQKKEAMAPKRYRLDKIVNLVFQVYLRKKTFQASVQVFLYLGAPWANLNVSLVPTQI